MMQTRGLELILYNLNLSEKLFRKAMKKAIKAGGEVLDKEIIKNISLICHSLEDLKRMGHPYGKKPRPGRMPIPHTPKWLVHMQTGDLRKSFFSEDIEERQLFSHVAGVDPSIAPHARYVILGTSIMIQRDFLYESLMTAKVDIKEKVGYTLGREQARAALRMRIR